MKLQNRHKLIVKQSRFAYVVASNATKKYSMFADEIIVCDSVSDEVQINLALANYAVVELSDGTFNIASKIVGGGSLLGQGETKTIIQGANGLAELILLGGSRFQLVSDFHNGVAQTTSAGSTTVGLNNNVTASVSVGDRLLLAGNQVRNQVRGQYTVAEDVVVEAITSNLLTIREGLDFGYINSGADFTRMYKYNLANNVRLQGIRFQLGTGVSDADNQNTAIRIQYAQNASISNVHFEGDSTTQPTAIGFSLYECFDSVIQNCVANYVKNGTNTTATGYCFYVEGGRFNRVRYVSGIGKHLIDCDKQNWMSYARDITFEYIETGSQGNAGTNNRAFSTHGGSKRVRLTNLKQKFASVGDTGLHVGFITRGEDTIIENCEIDVVIDSSYVSTPFFIGENIAPLQGGFGLNGDGRCCERLKILNNYCNIIRNGGSYFTSTNQGNFISLETNAIDVEIANNYFNGLHRTGVNIFGNNNSGIKIKKNIFDFYNQLAGEKIGNVAPKNSTNNATNVSFLQNTVSGANDNTSPKVKGLVDTLTYIEN